jgi:hypothetical protein
MNTFTHGSTALEVADCDLAPACQVPGSWLPPGLRTGRALDPQLWRTRAARGLTWHRTGRANRPHHADYAQ